MYTQRDKILALELEHILSNPSVSPQPAAALLHHSLILPPLLSAELQASSLSHQLTHLLRSDKLFSLSMLFGDSLIDRTGTLQGPLQTTGTFTLT